MLDTSFPLSVYEMATAVQPQVAQTQTNRLLSEPCHPGSDVRSHAGLVARLRITDDPAKRLALNPPSAVSHAYGEGSPFIIAPNVKQQDDGLTAVILGQPGIAGNRSARLTTPVDAAGLLELYKAVGKDCVAKLRGSWAIVIVDPRQDRVLLANDRMGTQSLYFRIGRDTLLVGNEMAVLAQYSPEAGLDAQSLYHYLYFHMVPTPGVVVDRFHKLGPALMLELTPQGHNLNRYWTPSFNENTTDPVAGAHAKLRTQLKTAVERCSASDTPGDHGGNTKVGAFLSGGLDSSTVAGMLSELQGGSCDAYTIGFDAEGYDEMPYARLAARHFGIRLHEHYVTPNEVVEALPAIAAAFDEPFGNSSVLPAYFCARMAAEDGTGVLLAGDGGDELFAGNSRYGGQQIFEDYRETPQWLRSRVIEPLVNSMPAGLPLVAKGQSFIRQANTTLPQRLQYYSFLEQNSPREVFSPAFLNRVNPDMPSKLLQDIYQLPRDASALNRMLFLDWQVTLADNDLRKVTRACELAGVRVRYPMLDDDLVEFSTTIPSTWKLPGNKSKGHKLRHFYKQALAGWLPDATIRKPKQGFGLPFGLWMKDHKPLQEMAFDNILALKARGIFLPAFLDRAISSHRDDHAAYFGELIWVLMSLELWLAANRPGYSFESGG